MSNPAIKHSKACLLKVVMAMLLAGTLSILASGNAWCMMISMPLDTLARSSELVVHGRVQKKQSMWSADKKFIYTLVTLSVTETIVGDSPATGSLVLRHLGGEVGGMGLKISDTPSFEQGEEVVVFLRPAATEGSGETGGFGLQATADQGELYELVGLAQGKFSIGADKQATRGGYSILGADKASERSLSLEELKRRILQAVE